MEVSVRRPTQAVEPPASMWEFPPAPPEGTRAPGRSGGSGGSSGSGASGGPSGSGGSGTGAGSAGEIVGIGADLEPGTLLSAYRTGVFPMPVRRGLMAWWSPDPRGVIPLDGLRVSRSLRKSCERYSIRIDTCFEEVIAACGDKRRPGAWIDRSIKRAYTRLHEWGWAHSVEAFDPEGRLAGGLYGVAIGGFFAGESMFHRGTDASKVALVALVALLRDAGAELLDVQWATPHLKSLGTVEVRRDDYLRRLEKAILLPQPGVFGG